MDQTQFEQVQQILQAPPEELNKPKLEKKPLVTLNKRTKLVLGFGGLAIVLLLVLAVLSTTTSRNRNPGSGGEVGQRVTLATPTPKPNTELGNTLLEIEQRLDAIDPSETELDTPPVSYEIRT